MMKDDTTHDAHGSYYETFIFHSDTETRHPDGNRDRSLPQDFGFRGNDDAQGAHSRRTFLRSLAAVAGGAWLGIDWSAVDAAHSDHTANAASASYSPFLTKKELADVAAIAAQIIPTDSTPGAREAGVGEFIDRALATYLARMAPTFRNQLTEFRAQCLGRYPSDDSFAELTTAQQIEFLKSVEKTPFFGSMRLLTVIGMFAMPQYGGNRDQLGWKLLGFEDQHVFVPPFGYYDANYPGFEAQPKVRA